MLLLLKGRKIRPRKGGGEALLISTPVTASSCTRFHHFLVRVDFASAHILIGTQRRNLFGNFSRVVRLAMTGVEVLLILGIEWH